jgi:hypothetical protein
MVLGRGLLWAHLFENQSMGVPRQTYWGLHVSDLQSNGCEVESINCDWLTFPVRYLAQLANASRDDCLHPGLVECTVYRDAEHHLVKLQRLTFEGAAGDNELTARLVLNIPSLAGETAASSLEIECPVRFEGLVVVPGGFQPPPTTAQDIAAIAAPFVDLEKFEAPVWDRFRYLLLPKT